MPSLNGMDSNLKQSYEHKSCKVVDVTEKQVLQHRPLGVVHGFHLMPSKPNHKISVWEKVVWYFPTNDLKAFIMFMWGYFVTFGSCSKEQLKCFTNE